MALRGTAVHVNGGVSTSNAVNVTGIVQANDVIILAAQWTGVSATFGLPSGFATIPGLSNQNCSGTTTMMALAYKVATGSETTLTITSSSNNLSSVVARVYSERNTGALFTAVASTANQTSDAPITYALTGLTAAASDDVVEFVGNQYYQGSNPAFVVPPGYGSALTTFNTITNVPILISCDYQGSPAGVTGTNGGKLNEGTLTGLGYCAQQISLAALNPPTITAVPGAFSLTGKPSFQGANAGAFAFTGQAALLFVGASGYQLAASPGSFSFIGANASEGLEMSGAAGVFSFGGFDVSLLGGLFITAVPGSFSFNGNFAVVSVGADQNPIYLPNVMPNVVGYEYEEALLILQQVSIFDPQSLGYFGTFPVTVIWANGSQSGVVLAQNIQPGATVATNAPITLTVADFPISVAFP